MFREYIDDRNDDFVGDGLSCVADGIIIFIGMFDGFFDAEYDVFPAIADMDIRLWIAGIRGLVSSVDDT